MSRVWVEPRSFDQSRHKNDAFTHSATLPIKEILLEIAFIEETRGTGGNKEMPQTFFHNSFYSQKYDLIR